MGRKMPREPARLSPKLRNYKEFMVFAEGPGLAQGAQSFPIIFIEKQENF